MAMASNSLFSSVTPCQQNFFWGECCEKLFSFHCGSAAGHTEVKQVDNRWRAPTHAHTASGFTFKSRRVYIRVHARMLTCLCKLKTHMRDTEENPSGCINTRSVSIYRAALEQDVGKTAAQSGIA